MKIRNEVMTAYAIKWLMSSFLLYVTAFVLWALPFGMHPDMLIVSVFALATAVVMTLTAIALMLPSSRLVALMFLALGVLALGQSVQLFYVQVTVPAILSVLAISVGVVFVMIKTFFAVDKELFVSSALSDRMSQTE